MVLLDQTVLIKENKEFRLQFYIFILYTILTLKPEMGLIETFIPRVVVPDPREGGTLSETTYRVQVFA